MAGRSSNHLLRNYEILNVLGSGSFGVVFHCRHRLAGGEYAIKVTKLIEADTDAYREIENLLNVPNHPNFVQYFDCWDDSFSIEDVDTVRNRFGNTEDFEANHFAIPRGQSSFNAICIKMELCGGNLRQWIHYRGDEVNEEEAMDIFIQLVQGVEHLHNSGLFHRDLKPENVFFSNGGDFTIKIGDLGIATGCTRRRYTTALGTRQYFAPEQEGNLYTKAVDIFSLGIIFLELLYPPMNTTDDMHSNTLLKLKYFRTVPEEVWEKWPRSADLILKMVELRAEDRPAFEGIYATFQRPSASTASSISSPLLQAHATTVAQDEPSDEPSQANDVSNRNGVDQRNSSNSTSSGYDTDTPNVGQSRPQSLFEKEPVQPQSTQQSRPAQPPPPRPKVTVAKTSSELHQLLTTSQPGDTIELIDSQVYEGDFELKTSRITIDGNNAEVKGVKIGLSITANRCIVKNLIVQGEIGIRVHGNGNGLDCVTILKSELINHLQNDRDKGIIVIGNCNLLRSILVNQRFHGAEITGDSNVLDVISLDECSRLGIVVMGCSNTLNKVHCQDTPNSVWIKGNTNLISDMSYNATTREGSRLARAGRGGIAITIGGGVDNGVERFENNVEMGRYRYGIYSSIFSSGLTVESSSVGKFYLEGNDHLVQNTFALHGARVSGSKSKFDQVDCSLGLEVWGNKHIFVNCNTNQNDYQCHANDVEIVDCNFY